MARVDRETVPQLLIDQSGKFVWRKMIFEQREGLAQAGCCRSEDSVQPEAMCLTSDTLARLIVADRR